MIGPKKKATAVLFLLLACLSLSFAKPKPAPKPKAAAPPPKDVDATLSFSAIFQDMGDATEAQVRKEAERQAASQPRYKSGRPESKLFDGCYIPRKEGTNAAVFSDDGVDVEVDGEKLLSNFGAPQHLPKLAKSFHVLKPPKGGWVKDKMYHVKVKYSNIIFTGNADIDGCTFFAYNGGGTSGEALITYLNRHGKKEEEQINKTKIGAIVIRDNAGEIKDDPGVYKDKDEPAKLREIFVGMKGGKPGTKLKVRRGAVNPERKFNLHLFDNSEGKGKDLFLDKGKEQEEIELAQGNYWLKGGKLASEHVRDHFLEAKLVVGDSPCNDQMNVTVLWVNIDAAAFGSKIDEPPIYEWRGSILALKGNDELGVQRNTNESADGPGFVGGWIKILGSILPNDGFFPSVKFNDMKEPREADHGFIIRRFVTRKQYVNGRKEAVLKFKKEPDDSLGDIQDVDPSKDKAGNLIIEDVDGPGSDVNAAAYFRHFRDEFTQHIVFNFFPKTPERCSERLIWSSTLDFGLGYDQKALFLFRAPNQEFKPGQEMRNQVLIGQKLEKNLEINIPAKPELDSAATGAGDKKVKKIQDVEITVKGKDLVGEFFFKNKEIGEYKAREVHVKEDDPKTHTTKLTEAKVTFFIRADIPTDKGPLELFARNAKGDSNSIGGFEIVD